MRFVLSSVAISLFVAVACARLTPASGIAPPSTDTSDSVIAVAPSPSPTPSYSPGPDSTSGSVVRRTPTGVVLNSAGTEIDVDLRSVVDVWRETSVPASAIEIGDDLFVNGTRGASSFVARYAWANIGRLDGMIRAFDGREMLIAYQRAGAASTEMRVELSRYVGIVELGPGGERPADRADLTLGRSVGMVIYRSREMPIPRATRIWLWTREDRTKAARSHASRAR
jgi:hypothetical protein